MEKHPYIMVVDDDQEMMQMLKRILEPEGYGVVTAADGASEVHEELSTASHMSSNPI